MIFSAMVILLGFFAVLVELLDCFSGFADFDVDLSTLKPILNGAGAVVVAPGADDTGAEHPAEDIATFASSFLSEPSSDF